MSKENSKKAKIVPEKVNQEPIVEQKSEKKDSLQDIQVLKCPDHPKKRMRYLCEVENLEICEVCVTDKHQGHKVQTLETLCPPLLQPWSTLKNQSTKNYNIIKGQQEKLPEGVMDKVQERYEKLCSIHAKVSKLNSCTRYLDMQGYQDSIEKYKKKVQTYLSKTNEKYLKVKKEVKPKTPSTAASSGDKKQEDKLQNQEKSVDIIEVSQKSQKQGKNEQNPEQIDKKLIKELKNQLKIHDEEITDLKEQNERRDMANRRLKLKVDELLTQMQIMQQSLEFIQCQKDVTLNNKESKKDKLLGKRKARDSDSSSDRNYHDAKDQQIANEDDESASLSSISDKVEEKQSKKSRKHSQSKHSQSSHKRSRKSDENGNEIIISSDSEQQQ